MIKKPILFITIEHSQRELLPKAYLAGMAAQKGFRVYLGSFRSIIAAAAQSAPAIIFHKSTWQSYISYFKSLGHKVVFLDEEAGFAIPRPLREEFVRHRYQHVNPDEYSAVFTLNANYQQLLSDNTGIKEEALYSFGWPRIDLWHTNSIKPTSNQTSTTKKNKNILFISSFGANSEKQFKKRINNAPTEWREAIITRKRDAFRNNVSLINYISEKLPSDYQITIRPHPSESAYVWRKLTRDLKNTTVTAKGDIGTLIQNADVLINGGSTAAVQAALTGKPSLCFRPPDDRRISATPIFEISQQTYSFHDSLEFLINTNHSPSEIIQNSKILLSSEVHNAQRPVATENIVNQLITMAPDETEALQFSKSLKFKSGLIRPARFLGYHGSVPFRATLGVKTFNSYEKLEGGIAVKVVKEYIDTHLGNNTITVQPCLDNLVLIENYC